MSDRRDYYDLLESIFPPEASAPAEQVRQVIARGAFLLAFFQHREKETTALFERWAGRLRLSTTGSVEWPGEEIASICRRQR